MKKIILYYFLIITPIVHFIYLVRTEQIGTTWIIIYSFTYLLVYRTLTDFYRLKSKGILKNKDFFKVLIPGFRYKYFMELYT